MPALNAHLPASFKILAVMLILTLNLNLIPAHAGNTAPPTTSSLVPVNLVINYGNGTLEWHNGTRVSADSNFYNVTVAATNGNVAAVFFQSFGSHFVYLINGVGCPTVFGCNETWSLWVLNGLCWELSDVGPDQILVSERQTVGWLFVPLGHFGQNPPSGASCLNVDIDIKPGSDSNPVNIRSQGPIPVAVLTTPLFDASKIDVSSIRFGRTGTEAAPIHSGLEDVDVDGDLDLMIQFRVQDTVLQPGDTQARLTGRTINGTPITGTGSLRVFFPGDVDGDLDIDISDASLLALAYASTPGITTWNAQADFNGDNVVNILDAALLASYYGRHA